MFVLPTRLESFGIAALEARSAGLPVVAMKETGIEEFISEGREGLLAVNDDDMIKQIIRLIIDRPLRRSITDHNLKTAAPYDWSEVTAQHLKLYRLALKLKA